MMISLEVEHEFAIISLPSFYIHIFLLCDVLESNVNLLTFRAIIKLLEVNDKLFHLIVKSDAQNGLSFW